MALLKEFSVYLIYGVTFIPALISDGSGTVSLVLIYYDITVRRPVDTEGLGILKIHADKEAHAG